MDKYVIRLEDLAGRGSLRLADAGSFVRKYDPANNELVLTKRLDRAKMFASPQEAIECYRQDYGVRPDGRPNRPLTAWTVSIMTVEAAARELVP